MVNEQHLLRRGLRKFERDVLALFKSSLRDKQHKPTTSLIKDREFPRSFLEQVCFYLSPLGNFFYLIRPIYDYKNGRVPWSLTFDTVLIYFSDTSLKFFLYITEASLQALCF